jgi:long-chain fatty acid transport protein
MLTPTLTIVNVSASDEIVAGSGGNGVGFATLDEKLKHFCKKALSNGLLAALLFHPNGLANARELNSERKPRTRVTVGPGNRDDRDKGASSMSVSSARSAPPRSSYTSCPRNGRVRCIAEAIGLALLLVGWESGPARASGYALREQSASAIGNAFAGATAGADDLSYMFFNPAGITRLSGSQIIGGANLIMPQLKFHDGEASTATGATIGGNSGGSDAGEDALVPVFYGLWDVQESLDLEENIKVGVGVNVPFGVETDYQDGWIGRYYGLHSKVQTVNVNPVVAWEVTKGVSLAAGLQVQYVKARLTNAIDFGTIGAARGIPGSDPGQQDGRGKASGDDIGYGFNVGALFEPWAGTRVGASYRSAIHHTLDGDGNFDLGGSTVAKTLASTGAFQDTGIKANVTTPETVSFGVYHDITPEWAVMSEAAWTRWSRFHDLTIKFDNPAQPNSVTNEDWRDTWFLALGATWRPNETWTLRGGAAWDQDPTRNQTRTPRIPTDNRYWLSFGAGWTPLANVTVDLGYTHVFFDNASIKLSADDSDNAPRGNLSGNFEDSVDIIALQARWVF